jgi:hypothetical protein
MLQERSAIVSVVDGQRFIETADQVAVFQDHADVMGGQNNRQG